MNELEARIYELAGEQFNIASPKQVGDILFAKMQIVEKPKKTVERTEEKVEREPQPVSVTEQMKPTVDLAPKPAVPAVPEKITIKPVDTSKP